MKVVLYSKKEKQLMWCAGILDAIPFFFEGFRFLFAYDKGNIELIKEVAKEI